MTRKLFLALDQGGQSSRALVIDNRGEILAQADKPVSTSTPQPGWVEQDPEELFSSILHSAKCVLERLSCEQRNLVQSAALVTQRSSLVCWHRQTGQALYPVISWQDTRAANWLAEQAVSNEYIQKRTGLRLSPHYGVSKIRWCLDHVDAVRDAFLEGVLCIGPLSSFLTSRLSPANNIYVDPANASRTLLYNIEGNCWDEQLLSIFSIPKQVLPIIVPTNHTYGALEIGGICIPLQLVNGDQSAAFFASGSLNARNAYINVGTGAFIAARSDAMNETPSSLLKSIIYSDSFTDGKGSRADFVIEGTVNGAASSLVWAQKEFGLDDIEWFSEYYDQTELTPLFINSIGGIGSPFWRTDIAPVFIGEASSELKVVAVLESIIFLLCENLQHMQNCGFDPKRLVVSGGLANIDSFCQKLANISAVDVWRSDQIEATARGAVYLLAGKPKGWLGENEGKWFRSGGDDQHALKERFSRWRIELKKRINH